MTHKITLVYVTLSGELSKKKFYLDELVEFQYEFVDYDPTDLLVDQEVEKILKGHRQDSLMFPHLKKDGGLTRPLGSLV
ncbi:unnamed protein product [marine sediment metagenome]|uniref:Uncharacterized protein n=1 Tax=marine sediment metagenome TaxID=412755 RepID=X1DX96_9ZZZZ